MLEKEKVYHKKLKAGEIVSCDKKHMTVYFSDSNEVLRLNNVFVLKNNLIEFNNPDATIVLKKLCLLDKLNDFDKKYNFDGFIHTTEFENFKSIIKCGQLIPRLKLNDKDYIDVADPGAINNTNNFVKESCRFYYSYHTPTNYKANYSNPVIMVFDESLIFENNSYFTSINAAKNGNGFTNNIDEALRFNWEGIFERGDQTQSKYCAKDEYGNRKIILDEKGKHAFNRDEISAMRNAEFIIHGNVDISFIKKIYFISKEQLEDAKQFCPEEMWYKFDVDISRFDIKKSKEEKQ